MTLYRGKYRIESTRLPGWDYSARGWYFVTMCTENRQCSLGSIVSGKMHLSPAGEIAERELPSIAEHHSNVWIDSSVVMPNHVHVVIVIDGVHQYTPSSGPARERSPNRLSLSTIVGGYKAAVINACRKDGLVDFHWQPRFYDHILGSNTAIDAASDYIKHNAENRTEDSDHLVITNAIATR